MKMYDKQIESETTIHVRLGKLKTNMFSNSHSLKNNDLILSRIQHFYQILSSSKNKLS